MKNKIKWLINDLGLNELNAYLFVAGSAITAAALVLLLSGDASEVWRYWRVFFLKLPVT